MKLYAIILCIVLSACAAPAPQVDARVAQFNAWADAAQLQVGSGQMKHSDYYTEAYNRLAQIRDGDPQRIAMMRGFAELIPVARAYETGAITRDQLEDVIRLQQQAFEERSAAAEDQKRRAIAEAMMRMDAYTRATEPPQLAQPVETTCRRIGGMVKCLAR